MVNKVLNMLSITLFAFVVSYLMASVFDNYGLQTNYIFNSILIIIFTIIIIAITIIIFTVINKYFISRQSTENK